MTEALSMRPGRTAIFCDLEVWRLGFAGRTPLPQENLLLRLFRLDEVVARSKVGRSMTAFSRAFRWPQVLAFLFALLGGFSCASDRPAATPPPAAAEKPSPPPAAAAPRVEPVFSVMLGIDVLAA